MAGTETARGVAICARVTCPCPLLTAPQARRADEACMALHSFACEQHRHSRACSRLTAPGGDGPVGVRGHYLSNHQISLRMPSQTLMPLVAVPWPFTLSHQAIGT